MTDQQQIPLPKRLLRPLQIREKLLLTPGPNNVSPRVTQALSFPILGTFHQSTLEVMDDIKEGLQYIFQTENKLTLAVNGSGTAGMEAALCNLLEPGDKVIVLVSGVWGQRAAEMALRYGGDLIRIDKNPGEYFEDDEVESAVLQHQPAVVFIVHGESSTGVLQPLQTIGEICSRNGSLLIVDAVASLAAVPLLTDQWKLDCVYGATQKTLSAPPGLSPITFSPRAVEKILNRKSAVKVFYFDMKPLGQYWNCFQGQPRLYHHTMPSSLLYALREALAMIVEEGLENVIERHKLAAKEFHEGLDKLSFRFFVENPAARLPTITTVKIPENVDPARFLATALNEYDMEIGAGFGPTTGKAFRIGTMGCNACTETVQKLLLMLRDVLPKSQMNTSFI